MRKWAMLSFTVCMLALSGCGVIDKYYLPVPQSTVQEIFEAGNEAMTEKKYGQAAVYFSQVKDEYPFSPYAIEAELSLGDAYFLDKKYRDASEAYKSFEDLHPRNEAMPYVLYQLGTSLKLSYVSVDRATTEVEEALQYFDRLEQSYPGSEYAEKAKAEIAACRRLLAERGTYIGDVFWSMGNYEAAWTRFKSVADTYPDVTDVAAYARQKSEAAYMKFRENSAERTREEREGSWKQYFKWL